MKRAVQAVLILGLIALGFWLWTVMFPSPERAIRARLNALAKAVSFNAKSGMLSQAYNAEKVGEFFTTDVDVEVDASGYGPMSFHGRDEIQQAAMSARAQLRALKVEFPDMNITLDPDKQGAKVNLTGKATVPGEKDISAQEFNLLLKKVDGKWMIYRVETVKTLAIEWETSNAEHRM